MKFFSQFPKVPYTFDEFTPNINTTIIDMYRYVDVNRDVTSDLAAYLTYSIKDGERPDQVSHKLYKTPDYHWTFFIINELLKDGMKNWPKGYIELGDYLRKKYGPYSVLEFFPFQSFFDDGKLAQYKNYLGGIEFDGRLKLFRKTSEGEGHHATPVLYDSDKLQLWVKDVESSFLTNDDAKYYFIYEGSKKQQLAWAENHGLPWCKEYYPEIYEKLLNETTVVDDNIAPFARGEIDFEESAQVFDLSVRTLDMFDQNQIWDSSYFNDAAEFDWEDGFVSTEESNDEYDVTYLFNRTQITSDDLDSSQNWLRSRPERFLWPRREDSYLLTGVSIPADLDDEPRFFVDGELEAILSSDQLSQEARDGLIAYYFPPTVVSWVGASPATEITDDPFKSEWYPYGTDALGTFFMSKYLSTILFETNRSWVESFNAPQSYVDSNDTRITAYDALRELDLDENLARDGKLPITNNPNYTTYYEYENDENEAKRDIVVLRESAVEPFAERYEELLNE